MREVVDVVVIGGGSAGICAAIAAARRGAKVVLIEQSGKLGGMGSLAWVHTFCGLYLPDTSKPPVVANPGLPEEIEVGMRKCTGQAGPVKMGKVYVLPQQPEMFNQLTQKMVLAESDHLSLRLNSTCHEIVRNEDGRFLVKILSDGQSCQMLCRSVVDCSADAVVAGLLGATRRQVRSCELQRPAYIFSLKNVGEQAGDDSFKMRLALDLVHAVRAGELPPAAMGATMRPSPSKGEVFISIDLDTPGGDWNPGSLRSREEIAEIGKECAYKLAAFFQGNYPCFQHVSAPGFPTVIGVRESDRWLGQYTLSGDDLISGQKFDDVVAYATWPIELRETTKGAKFQYFENATPSQVPLRSLTSQEIPGVYFAGRCLSATHRALASVRVMGTCFATGQAVGMAAALYAEGETNVSNQAQRIQDAIWGPQIDQV